MISNKLIEEANKIADKNIVNVVENLYKSFIDEKKNQLIIEAGQALERHTFLSIKIKRINKYVNLVGYNHVYSIVYYDSLQENYTRSKAYYHELKDKLKEDFDVEFNIHYWNKIKGILK